VVGPWWPRSSQVRLRVEDGLVAVQVSGVLDAHTAAMTRDEVLSMIDLTNAVVLDLRGVCELRTDAHLQAFLKEVRSRCRLTRCRLQVIATHPHVLQVLKSWGTESTSWWAESRPRSSGIH
jgi:anti-anti-sigma regulatory factor